MDKILKAMIFDNSVSLTIIESTEMVNESIRIHNLSPLSAATLGRTLTIGAFMCANLKNDDENLSINIKCDGIMKGIVVCGDNKLNMRGEVFNDSAVLPLKKNGKLDVGGAVGKGRLSVVKNMRLKGVYSGSVELVSGEIAEDFAKYFAVSEQTPTAIALGVEIGMNGKCNGAGGVVMQLLPNCSEENIKKVEDSLANFSSVSSLIVKMGAYGILKNYFDEKILEEVVPKYNCLCSRKYIESVLVTMSKEDIESILETEGKIQVQCHFCNKKYEFTKEDMSKLLEENSKCKVEKS